jgi:predicted DNA-binding protein (UPF0251 family)
MKTIHFDPKTMPAEAKRIFKLAFPSYNGKKFKLRGTEIINMASYWDGGSRDYYVVVRIDGATLTVPQQSAFDKPVAGVTEFSIPEGFAVVEHSIFCGKDMGLTLHVPPSRMAQLAPATVALTDEQRTVLRLTASYKSCFRREAAARNGISRERWAELVAELAELGMLRKNGSITPEGRNNA